MHIGKNNICFLVLLGFLLMKYIFNFIVDLNRKFQKLIYQNLLLLYFKDAFTTIVT